MKFPIGSRQKVLLSLLSLSATPTCATVVRREFYTRSAAATVGAFVTTTRTKSGTKPQYSAPLITNYRVQQSFLEKEHHHQQRHSTHRSMTTAYSGDIGDGTKGMDQLDYLPIQTTLHAENGKVIPVQVGPFQNEQEWHQGMELMNLIIREGKSWPFDVEFETMDDYRSYFLSHAAFVVRSMEDNVDNNNNNNIMGCFYVKPNYPGRCSHICNGGFITHPKYRRMGVARLMGQVFLQVAHDLGYKSAYFNLVFESNKPSIALWESLGFQRVATLEKAADLKGVDGLDTAYGYRYDLEQLDDADFTWKKK